jgi:hypothetical protein
MKKYVPSATRDSLSIEAWTSVKMFAAAADSVKGNITRASVLGAMKKLRNYSSGGIIPPYSTNVPWAGLGGSSPRVFNPNVVICKSNVKGQLTAVGGFYNPVP